VYERRRPLGDPRLQPIEVLKEALAECQSFRPEAQLVFAGELGPIRFVTIGPEMVVVGQPVERR
jgi:hypothetical protein